MKRIIVLCLTTVAIHTMQPTQLLRPQRISLVKNIESRTAASAILARIKKFVHDWQLHTQSSNTLYALSNDQTYLVNITEGFGILMDGSPTEYTISIFCPSSNTCQCFTTDPLFKQPTTSDQRQHNKKAYKAVKTVIKQALHLQEASLTKDMSPATISKAIPIVLQRMDPLPAHPLTITTLFDDAATKQQLKKTSPFLYQKLKTLKDDDLYGSAHVLPPKTATPKTIINELVHFVDALKQNGQAAIVLFDLPGIGALLVHRSIWTHPLTKENRHSIFLWPIPYTQRTCPWATRFSFCQTVPRQELRNTFAHHTALQTFQKID